MDSFKVVITDHALAMLNEYADYLTYEKQSPFAGDAVHQDALFTIKRLRTSAGSLALCVNPRLAQKGYRKVFFQKHRYVMLYRLHGNTAVIEAVYHQSQDYENKFLKEEV